MEQIIRGKARLEIQSLLSKRGFAEMGMDRPRNGAGSMVQLFLGGGSVWGGMGAS